MKNPVLGNFRRARISKVNDTILFFMQRATKIHISDYIVMPWHNVGFSMARLDLASSPTSLYINRPAQL